MNDNAVKNYAIWARRELMVEVEKRCAWWGISENAQADVDSIDGRVLSAQEHKQRGDLMRIVRVDGYGQLIEKAAYTWFNRLLAIRFMEVNDRLPSHVRLLSSASGEFEPQCLREALDLPLDALDKSEVAKLVQSGDDEALFRLVFLAQCAELASCMPAVFDPVGSAMELLLPTGLLREDGIIGKLVTDIPEDDWRKGVEIVGWMYQYYVSERKDEVFAGFKKGKKADRETIAPATQLFTPHWIVRFLTENSLGRLWMVNHPDSKLVEKMPYFVKLDDESESEFRRISSPEEITCVDPACGSGHIVVYAFELLAAMYEEAGYSNRDAARLIIEKNLIGLEIDPRAGAMASFALTMKACELDSRFLRRGIAPNIVVLSRLEFLSDELDSCPRVAEKTALLDAVAHLDECGSLLRPEKDDLAAVENDLASLADDGSLFVGSAVAKLKQLQNMLKPLVNRYDVIIANPPYMGSNSLGPWMSSWVKKQYPDEKSDLCTSFIERGFTLGRDDGTNAMVTMQSWMFLGSYENMRGKMLRNHSIYSMAHLGTRAFGAIAGEVVSTTATVFGNPSANTSGKYLRLVDFAGEDEKRLGCLEALSNSGCEWLYESNGKKFEMIPGKPIAYWASDAILSAFSHDALADTAKPLQGLSTADNKRFLRSWWETDVSRTCFSCKSREESRVNGMRWFPFAKGGEYRKWYGNITDVVNWENDGLELRNYSAAVIRNPDFYFKEGVTWTKISSSGLSARYVPAGCLFSDAGPLLIGNDEYGCFYLLALMNSPIVDAALSFLAPTLNYSNGDIGRLPVMRPKSDEMQLVKQLANECMSISKTDWDDSEASWSFRRHPLV